MSREFPLAGPPVDSLLGMLSLLGLLRSLEEARSDWKPTLSWKKGVPHLRVDGSPTEEDVADAAVQGIEEFGKKLKFPAPDPGVDVGEFRKWQREMDPEAVAAIGSDACLKKDKDVVETTVLCMMFGAGWQNFLSRLADATTVGDGGRSNVQKDISAALFSRWLYTDTIPKIAFRWDPTEYRPHALQSTDPKGDLVQTVNGANRLAAVGFTTYQCVPTRRGLSTVSCMAGGARRDYVMWPVCQDHLSLAALRILMRHPSIKVVASGKADLSARKALRSYGVGAVMKAEVFWDGKFKNVGRAEPLAV